MEKMMNNVLAAMMLLVAIASAGASFALTALAAYSIYKTW